MLRATWVRLYLIVMLAMMSAGCEIVGGIFKAGMWVGIIMVVLVIAIIMWVLRRIGG
jgi:hypothetical protein